MRLAGAACLALLVAALALPSGAPAVDPTAITTCDDAHVQAAAAAGGTYEFQCSATIELSKTLVVAPDKTLALTVDGDHDVTLDGRGVIRIFRVDPRGSLSLDTITLAHGAVSAA